MRGIWSPTGDHRELDDLVVDARVRRVELRDIQIVTTFLSLLRLGPERANIDSQYPIWLLLSHIINCLISGANIAIILRSVEVGQRIHVESFPRKVFPIELLNYYGSRMKGDQHVRLRDPARLAPLLPVDHILNVRPVLVSEYLDFGLELLESRVCIIAVAALVTTSEASDQVSAVQVVPLMI